MRIAVWFLSIFFSVAHVASAADIREVVVVGPSWDKFTNRDGTGLYHEILDQVFSPYGIVLNRVYVPSHRANDLVRAGKADIMTCSDRAEPPLLLGKYPMYEGEFHTFFNRKRQPEWKGPETLSGHSVTFRFGYYSKENFPDSVILKEVNTAEAAFGMVLLGQADYYVDDLNFIKQTMEKSRIPFDASEYAIQSAGRRQYFPVLLDSPRGRQIADLYAKGMEQLYTSGRLEEIFKKWGFLFPHYEVPQ